MGEQAPTAQLWSLVFRPPDDATGDTRAGVAGWLGFEIVRLSVNYNGSANDRPLVVRERYLMVDVFQLRLARSVCLYISHVALMPFGCVRPCMRFVGWIKMSAGGSGIGRATIAELMDMKAMVAGYQAANFRPHLYSIGHFGKCHGAAHFVACGRMKHRNGFRGS